RPKSYTDVPVVASCCACAVPGGAPAQSTPTRRQTTWSRWVREARCMRPLLTSSQNTLHKQANRSAPTMAELAAQYIDLYAKVHKKSWQRDAWLLAKEVVPVWGTRKAHDIRRRDVIALLGHVVERGAPIQANRILSLVRKLFNWAVSREL